MLRAFFLLICLPAMMISCKKNNTPTIPLNEMVNDTAVLTYSGEFVSGPYGTVSGKAEIYTKGDSVEVKLANFNSTNGPALHVYISKQAMPVNFIDLGVLKSTTGNQVYSVAGMPDFMEYKYISIHCVAFNHLFGAALVQ